MTVGYQDVLAFWFDELSPRDWFNGGKDIDQLIIERFAELHSAAVQGELYTWRESALGRLTEIIVLDQFSRNIGRDTPQAFSADPMALVTGPRSGGWWLRSPTQRATEKLFIHALYAQ